MEKIKLDLDQLQEKLRGMLYQSIHYQDEFERNCYAKTEEEKKLKLIINDMLKIIKADIYRLSEILTDHLNSLQDTNKEEVLLKGGDSVD